MRVLTGAGDAAVLATAALLYGVAGLLALRMPRDLLGPDPGADRPALTDSVRHVASGLVDGLRHLAGRRDPAAGLVLIAGQRYLFGITAVLLVLLFRNGLHPDDSDAAFAALGRTTLVGGAGFVVAALLTPVVVERLAPRRWIVLLLVLAAVVQLLPAVSLTTGPLLAASFVVGLAAQGIKICVDTFVQRDVEDVFRGRVFSVYDVLFNVAFVAAAASAAVVLPSDGRSPRRSWWSLSATSCWRSGSPPADLAPGVGARGSTHEQREVLPALHHGRGPVAGGRGHRAEPATAVQLSGDLVGPRP